MNTSQTNSNRTVLIISFSADYYGIDRIANHIEAQGAKAIRLNTDQFPQHLDASAYVSNQDLQFTIDTVIDQKIDSVYLRHIGSPQLPDTLSPENSTICRQESMATLDGLFSWLCDAKWLNTSSAIRDAENKMYQLKLAAQAGLRIPQTLVSNKADDVRAFYHKLNGKIITKLQCPVSWSMEGNGDFLYTSRVTENDIAQLEQLKLCPMIFQEEIIRVKELRIIYVEGQFYVGALHLSSDKNIDVDWRQDHGGISTWQHAELPDAVKESLASLMHHLALGFGAIDVMVTPNEQYVFLEVNPCGEWGMLERDLNLPISNAIANFLLH